MCFQVPFDFLSRPETRPNRVPGVLKMCLNRVTHRTTKTLTRSVCGAFYMANSSKNKQLPSFLV